MVLDVAWKSVEERLQLIGEGDEPNREAAGDALAGVLKRQPIVNALLEALWPLKR